MFNNHAMQLRSASTSEKFEINYCYGEYLVNIITKEIIQVVPIICQLMDIKRLVNLPTISNNFLAIWCQGDVIQISQKH